MRPWRPCESYPTGPSCGSGAGAAARRRPRAARARPRSSRRPRPRRRGLGGAAARLGGRARLGRSGGIRGSRRACLLRRGRGRRHRPAQRPTERPLARNHRPLQIAHGAAVHTGPLSDGRGEGLTPGFAAADCALPAASAHCYNRSRILRASWNHVGSEPTGTPRAFCASLNASCAAIARSRVVRAFSLSPLAS